ncbi:Cell division control protein 4 [Ceratocystis fimbriata CBS 114723]|uniref:Cell division control protein 4 n=1 Tax=Ceratocystis fimbriata CBS 114723 TaxID=1035309 RepID=A0A2C5WU02_9PEZI|nr:Cell division control protein 4 [Ceratocystis fimbriata CBS 114723]
MPTTPGNSGPAPNTQPTSSNHTVALRWDETASPQGGKSIQMAVAECVETKTVTTTTTTTTRTYPPMSTRQLMTLDAKEYPLAGQPIPKDLQFVALQLREIEAVTQKQLLPQTSPSPIPSQDLSVADSPTEIVATRRSLRSASRTEAHGIPVAKRIIRKSSRHTPSSDRLLRSVATGSRREPDANIAHWPSTPDAQDSRAVSPVNIQSSYNSSSPTDETLVNLISPSVATPPITVVDNMATEEINETLPSQVSRALHSAPRPDVVASQDASLPSPRLSPKLAAQMDADSNSFEGEDINMSQLARTAMGSFEDEVDAQMQLRERSMAELMYSGEFNPMSMIESFDAMPTDMKTFMMYQFLRRCPRKTLRVVANATNPALQSDFLRLLPLELSYQVLSYLDHVDLCRAARVSKQWRHLVDSNETGWKNLFDRDGFKLAPGELMQAITQGWGWQDPVGSNGAEVDLSSQQRLSVAESELTRTSPKMDISPVRPRLPKRKRMASMSHERLKRRIHRETQEGQEGRLFLSQSEGPLSAANSAALAVPDPKIGLDSLRTLHLYKSLYRRHHMIRQSWMNGKVKPKHIAFAAHPRHVITCLQFDEDKIITGSDDTEIHVYDTATGQFRQKLQGHEGGVWALQYEGNTLVSGSTDRTVRVWNIEKGICTQVFHGHTSTVRCLQILMPSEVGRDVQGQPVMMPRHPLIITGSRDYHLRVWRLPEANSSRWNQTSPVSDNDCPYFIRTLQGHNHSVRAIAAHGDTLVSGSYDNTVRVWKISTGESRHILGGHNQKVYSVVLDHERNRCISGSMDSMVKVWDLETGSCLFTLEGHTHLVGLLDLREGRLVSAAADSTLRIWNPEDGACRTVLAAHTGAITCFQHDARKVISGSEKAVKMWDIQSGQCVKDLLTNLNAVWQVKFDDRRCVAAVQRDALTYVEILDFGAVRDGTPPEELGPRMLVNEAQVRSLMAQQVE